MAKPDGGAAFPCDIEEPYGGASGATRLVRHDGMSLRDYFAGQALQGIVTGFYHPRYHDGENGAKTARHAYELADAMLAEREK